MRAFTVFLYLFVFVSPVSKGQYTEMVGKPYHERLDAIDQLYKNVIGRRMDSIALKDTLMQMRALANRFDDHELFLEADLLEAYRDYRLGSGTYVKIENVLAEGERQGVKHIMGRAMYVIANDHWNQQRYEQAFHWYIRLDSMLQQIDVSDFPNKAIYLGNIGYAHYYFGDYRQAIGYFEQVAAFPIHDFYRKAWRHAVNNMGLAYQQLEQLDKADSCFQKLDDEAQGKSEQWRGIAAGNMGYNHYLRKDYDRAVPLLEQDIRTAEHYEDFGLAVGSLIPLADVLIQQGDFLQAKHYLDKAYDYIQRAKQPDRLRLLYPVMSKWYMATNKPAEASLYFDSTLLANKNYNEKFSALRLLRANLEAMANQREAALQEQRVEHEQRVGRRNLILSILIILVLSVTFIAYRQRKTAEIRLKNNDLKLLKAEGELQKAQEQLEALAREALRRDHQIQQLQREGESVANNKLIEQLTQQVILTEAGWKEFSDLFGKVYPYFLRTVKSQYPILTPAEMRCLAMEKLRFSNKEMAALQGISTNAVMVTKHRIRKKVGLVDQQDMEKFISEIG